MALIKCPSCNKEISSEAVSCPSCGHPIKPQKQKNTSVFGVVVKVIIALFIIGLAIFVLFCVGIGYLGSNVNDQLEKARIENTKIQIVQLESALKLFKVDNGFYPDTQQGLDALIVMPTTGREPRRYDSSGYLDGDQIPLDQWGSEYIYIGPDQTGGTTYEIISPGQDGVPQTEDDISSRNIR
ncbi:MAG: type II secretion system major pseudopilin GspG [Candidatus Dadabacteria bacterium]|nr:type II secretion system major pseudopilin GspG [Candidatus Dadabacteria bacterium]